MDKAFAWTPTAGTAFPTVKAYIESWGVPTALVRVLGLEPGGFIQPHNDGSSFKQRENAIRMHIPLVTDPAVTMTIRGTAYHMPIGNVYFTAVEHLHSVSNDSSDTTRIHIVVDVCPCRAPWLMAAAELNGKTKSVKK